MALKKKTTARVTQAMKRFVAWLKYKSIGPHALTKSELKDLVRAGFITSGQSSKTAIARAYLTTHENMATEVAPKAVRDGAIDFLERMFGRYTEKAGQQFTNDLLNQIESQIMPMLDRTEGKQIYDILKDKDLHSKYLGNVLHDTVSNWHERWKLIVNTELSRATNYGALDAILTNNKTKDPHELVVYKIGPADGSVCDECKRLWFMPDFSTPRLYKLSELVANGSNNGRKRKDWMATIDNTHPNERHMVLTELKPGWGFLGGGLQYIGKDHDEYKKQR